MSSLTDRTDDVRITDAPVTFEMNEEWQKQWHEFEYFIERMHSYLCYAIPVEAVNYDDFQDLIAEAIKKEVANGATHLVYMDLSVLTEYQQEIAVPVHKMAQVTKLLLTLMRKADYNWFYEKCKQTIAHYEHLCHFLEDYSDKVTMPKLEVPKYDQDKTTPFITGCVSAVQDWKEARYDSETKITKMLPFKCVAPEPSNQGFRRRILIPVEDEEEPKPIKLETLYMYADDGLLATLNHLKEMFSIEEAWESAVVALSAMNARFYPEQGTDK